MKRIGDAMPLEPGGKPRVEVLDPGGFANVEVRVDGQPVHVFSDVVAMKAGWAGEVGEDRLEVAFRRRYGSILPRVDVRANGRALPRSGWDPERMVVTGSNLLLALGAWPLLELATATDAAVRTFLFVQAVVLAGLGALARTRIRGLVIVALIAGVVALVGRAVLVLAADVGAGWKVLSVLFVAWLLRDARASFDLRPR